MSTIEFETIGSRLQSLEAALQAQNESHEQIVLSKTRRVPPPAPTSASTSATSPVSSAGISIAQRPAPPVPQSAQAAAAGGSSVFASSTAASSAAMAPSSSLSSSTTAGTFSGSFIPPTTRSPRPTPSLPIGKSLPDILRGRKGSSI